MAWKIAVVFAVCIGVVLGASDKPWSYHGDNNRYEWAQNHDSCSADKNYRQSPVNFKLGSSHIHYEEHLSTPTFSPAYYRNVTAKMINTGAAMRFVFNRTEDVYVHVYDMSGYKQKYILHSGHFHYDRHHTIPGSEHAVNDKKYTGELHMVHYKANYPYITDALNDPSGLLVLGIFLEVEEHVQDQMRLGSYRTIFNTFKQVPNKGDPEATLRFTPYDLMPKDTHHLFAYDGGLTTPDCNGVVQWYVYSTPVQLPKEMIEIPWYSTVKDPVGDYQGAIWRPIQDLGTRIVRTNYGKPNKEDHDHSSAATRDGAVVMLISVLVFAAALLTSGR